MQTDLKADNNSIENNANAIGMDPAQSNRKRLSRRYGILRMFLLVLICGVLVFNIYKWNEATMSRDALPMPFGWGSAVIVSGSMEPVLSVNDLVVIHERDSYEEGNIVVYQNGGALVVHRIVSIDGDTYILQGDANNAPDEPITKDMIKGKMVLAIPSIGCIIRAIKSSPSTILIIIFAIYLAEYLWNKHKQIEQEKIESIKVEIALHKQELQLAAERTASEAEEDVLHE